MVEVNRENSGAQDEIEMIDKVGLLEASKTFAEKMRAESVTVKDAFNAVAELANNHSDGIQSFGLVFSGKQAPEGNADAQQDITVAKDIADSILKAIDIVVIGTQPHVAIVDTRLVNGVYKNTRGGNGGEGGG